ncbi:unnamed protein product, partial [Iphiclides podalirius]
MERQQTSTLQKFDDPKTEILKKRLLKATTTNVSGNLSQNNSQNNVLLNTLRAPIPSSMIVSSMQAPQSSMPITHSLVTHSIAPVKIHTMTQVPVGSNSTVVQIPNSPNNSLQLALPNSGNPGPVQLRNAPRTVPHVVYIQTPTGLKPVTSTEVISQASTSGNPPQIIVRRPVTTNSNIHLISNMNNKPNIAQVPKGPGPNKASILAPANTSQPIVIQKPKANDKMMVPVSIAPVTQGKQAIAYLGSVKKNNSKNTSENQSILISNNQSNVNANNQKLFLTPMNMPKIQNTKFILPVTLPATMASKGPIINLQIANGQIQNDPQGNITVMRDSAPIDSSDMPPLQPLQLLNMNGKDNMVPQSPKGEKSFAMSIPGSRAEPTGEQGEYTLSIPDTNASMNDDIYTVSIADEEGGQTHENSFTLAIPEKSKSLLNKNVIDRDMGPVAIAAPAILRRSNSDNSDRKVTNVNVKRRISLCNENLTGKAIRLPLAQARADKMDGHVDDVNDDHRVPSLFCDEKLDKDLDMKANVGDSDLDEDKDRIKLISEVSNDALYHPLDGYKPRGGVRQNKRSEPSSEEDPPGLIWSNGVARLQGSGLQFQTNEFGLIDLVDNSSDHGTVGGSGSKYSAQPKQRSEGASKEKKPPSPDDLYRCEGCGCHGMAAEFITANVCSLSCQAEVQKASQKKRDRERAELAKKRNKIKKLLMRKQLSDLDGQLDEVASLRHFDTMPVETQLTEVSLLKIGEEIEGDEKYPWMCGKSGFSWMRYLDTCKAKAAPVKLFKDPFPYGRNGFKVGMRLEAIDPQHPALFCVVSVAEVQGYRLRLHFDGYADLHDYWVNADSVDLFPPGWCERNGRQLKPPAGHSAATFSWPLYLKKVRAIAAPRHLFPHTTTTTVKPNGFRVGMKLEAEDLQNAMVCVASVADMLDHRLLVSFDSWDRAYDYWVDPGSPYIHPVGWARENGHALTPPNDYKDPERFTWEAYLAETGASAAPPRAFRPRAPQGFKPAMKLEVVDPRVPFLIRVATIAEVKGHQVRVTFDGWPDELSCWMDDDSPDLHPVGWCLKTGHPLEPPLTMEELRVSGPCGVGGCRGLGSVRGGAHKQHAAASACPYRSRLPLDPPDRLASVSAKSHKSQVQSGTPTSDMLKEKLPRGRPPKHKRVELAKNEHGSDDESLSSGAGGTGSGMGGKRWRGSTTSELAVRSQAWPRPAVPRALLAAHVAELSLPSDPVSWSQSEVAALVSRVAGAAAGAAAAAARLSGAELLMASCEELVACLRLRLGPAVKVYAAVRQLRDSLT